MIKPATQSSLLSRCAGVLLFLALLAPGPATATDGTWQVGTDDNGNPFSYWTPAPVAEPATWALWTLSLTVLVVFRRRQRI